jgi:carbonic anhydrase
MSTVTRRRFAAILGLVALDGAFRPGRAQQSHPNPAHPPAPAAPAPAPAAATKKPVAVLTRAPDAPKTVDRSTAKPEEIWRDLMAGNKRFTSGKTAVRDVVRARANTAKAQHPYAIVLCCADSRLSPELIFDQNIGDLFVVRTAGNVADAIALGSIEYAVEHLHARMLVVLGHDNCGAVTATLSGETMPTENLTALVNKIRPGIERLQGLVSGESLVSLAVEANVHRSAADVVEASPIVRHEIAAGNLSVMKAVYRLGSGEVISLNSLKENRAIAAQ